MNLSWSRIIKVDIIFIIVCVICVYIHTNLGVMLACAGIFIFLLWGLLQHNYIRRNGEKVIGLVTELSSSGAEDLKILVSFTTCGGQQVTGQPLSYTWHEIASLRNTSDDPSREVTVVYDKKKPQRFVLPEYSIINYFNTTIMLIFTGFGAGYNLYQLLNDIVW